jgi:hypothetical protein
MSFSPSGQSGRWGNRTLSNPVKGNWLAPSFLSQFGYLPFRKWSHRESNPDFQSAELVSSRWTMAPSVDRMGIEPITPTLQQSVASLGTCQPGYERSVRESNPVPLLTTEVCCRNTYRPSSDPGWNRTITLLGVIQASSPLDHGIKLGAGGEGLGASFRCRPTSAISSAPSPLVPSPQPLPKLQAPVSNRAHRPYEGQLGTCRACIK